MSEQVPLLPRYGLRDTWRFNKRIGFIFLKSSLPFYQSKNGTYVHRVRSGEIATWDGKITHACYSLWCGMTGSSGKGRLTSTPMVNDIVCATCEGRAIGSGQLGSPIIAGRVVRFSPRIAA